MIDDLAVAKTASFFVLKKRLSGKAVEALFVTLRANYDVSAHNIFKHTREIQGTARWSAICFTYEAPPSFLDSATDVRETLCGYLLLVEYRGHAAVFSSRIGLPASFKNTHFSPVPVERVEGAIAKGDVVFQRIRMRNMSVSQFAMRNKTLEAANLATVVGPAGSRRYVPRRSALCRPPEVRQPDRPNRATDNDGGKGRGHRVYPQRTSLDQQRHSKAAKAAPFSGANIIGFCKAS